MIDLIRKISADLIYTSVGEPLKNSVVVINNLGVIIKVRPIQENETEIEYYDGIICSGFINTHCHLELSHTKGLVLEKKGLTSFIKELQNKRESTFTKIQLSIAAAEQEMLVNGIVAVGDISNGTDSFAQKLKGNLEYHTFVEVFGFLTEKAVESHQNGVKLVDLLQKKGGKASLVPHSPYAVSEKLFELINANQQEIISIHNQESEEENLLFKEGRGAFLELMHDFGIDIAFWAKTNKNSLESVTPNLRNNKRILLVHNIFTTKKDIELIAETSLLFYWCFCPNANLYIENRLPNINLFLNFQNRITLGTDSLASNWQLSILEEMKTISKHFQNISLNDLVKWGTINGAQFLGLDKDLGSIEVGKKPGLNWITNINGRRLTKESRVKKLY